MSILIIYVKRLDGYNEKLYGSTDSVQLFGTFCPSIGCYRHGACTSFPACAWAAWGFNSIWYVHKSRCGMLVSVHSVKPCIP